MASDISETSINESFDTLMKTYRADPNNHKILEQLTELISNEIQRYIRGLYT